MFHRAMSGQCKSHIAQHVSLSRPSQLVLFALPENSQFQSLQSRFKVRWKVEAVNVNKLKDFLIIPP